MLLVWLLYSYEMMEIWIWQMHSYDEMTEIWIWCIIWTYTCWWHEDLVNDYLRLISAGFRSTFFLLCADILHKLLLFFTSWPCIAPCVFWNLVCYIEFWNTIFLNKIHLFACITVESFLSCDCCSIYFEELCKKTPCQKIRNYASWCVYHYIVN